MECTGCGYVFKGDNLRCPTCHPTPEEKIIGQLEDFECLASNTDVIFLHRVLIEYFKAKKLEG